MPHITLNSAEPGIRGLLRFRPETARPLSELTDVLLRGPSTLTGGERELITAYVSSLNGCRYCSAPHSATAAAQLPGGMALVEQVRADPGAAPVSAKLKALLAIAAAVRRSGLDVTAAQVAEARAAGATDLEIHDTVLIAAWSCLLNRYVDGLGAIAPEDPAVYAAGRSASSRRAMYRRRPDRISAGGRRGSAVTGAAGRRWPRSAAAGISPPRRWPPAGPPAPGRSRRRRGRNRPARRRR